MPRSSRHKSHKQSKNSSRDAREQSDSEADVKMKDRTVKEEGSVRVSRDSGSIEKRKLSSTIDPGGHGNGDVSEEYVVSKRRKEKADVGSTDRWNGGGGTVEKELKVEGSRIVADKGSKPTASVDTKSKSSKRHDSGSEKKEENVDLAAEKEESKSSSKVDSKRKSDKDSGRKDVQQSKEPKDKERGSERERERDRKIQEMKRETEAVAMKQASHSVNFGGGEKQGEHGRENTECLVEDELRNPELEKELEKRIRRRKDGSNEKEKYQDGVKESEDKHLSSRGELAKDGRHKDEKHKDVSYGDKRREDGDRDNRNKDEKEKHKDVSYGDKHREDGDRNNRNKDEKEKHKDVSYGDKHRVDGDRDNRNKDDKYREVAEKDRRHRGVKYGEDSDKDNRHRDEKYHDDNERDNRHRDDKYREDDDRDRRHKDDKYHEDGDRDKRRRDDKYHEDGERDSRHRGDKYREAGDRNDRHRDDRYLEDGNRDSRIWEDITRDGKLRDGKPRDDREHEKRPRDAKYRNETSSRDSTANKSDVKRLRDESNAAETHYRKSNNRDGSPIHDDRSTRYKDDKGRRRTSDKEDHGDISTRSAKEQYSDSAKKSMSMSSARVDSVSDRGRSNTRNIDMEISPNQSRRRSSPTSSSHAAKDHYRLSKQEGSKYRDYEREDRVRHNLTSSKEFAGGGGVIEKVSGSWSTEKSLPKDDSRLDELSVERRLKADSRISPLQVVDKSPSTTSADRRHLNRPDIRRSLDVEDSGQRSGGSKDTKDYSGRDGRGSRELAMETFPGDDLSQADGDNLSVSSPFSRTGHLSSNSRSLLPPPPPPFRTGSESPLVLRSLEDDNRGKSNIRHRRMGDPNMGRMHGSAWRGVPNWPSPLANGFTPFRHSSPSVAFHPMMQPFPVPPMFSVRPPMELTHSGVPYHVADGDRFSSHGRSLGWRNQVDDSCPPSIHGWDANSAVFSDESHIYVRPDWDHKRSLTGSRGWEASGETWKGQSSGSSTEMLSAPQKDDYSAQNDKRLPIVLDESINIDQSSYAGEMKTLESGKTIPEEMPNLSRDDDACLLPNYLSKLNISADLTEPELYSQCTALMGIVQNTHCEQDDSKFLLEEAIDTSLKITNNTSSSASLFPTVNDSVFQKAMYLYKKLREEVWSINGDKVPFSNSEIPESAPIISLDGAGSNDHNTGEVVPACDQQEAEGVVSGAGSNDRNMGEVVPACDQQEEAGVVSASNEVKMEVCPAITFEKLDEPVLSYSLEKPEESLAASDNVKMEVGLIPKQETLECLVGEKSSYPQNEGPDAPSPGKVEEVSGVCGSKLVPSATNCEGQEKPSDNCGPVLICESVESGSVNLSRIHQSPESTH